MPGKKQGNKNYKAGYRFERRVWKHFEKKGYFVVRSGGSKGPADLIALYLGEVLLIQCQTSKRFAPAKIKSLRAAAKTAAGVPMLVWRSDKNEICERVVSPHNKGH